MRVLGFCTKSQGVHRPFTVVNLTNEARSTDHVSGVRESLRGLIFKYVPEVTLCELVHVCCHTVGLRVRRVHTGTHKLAEDHAPALQQPGLSILRGVPTPSHYIKTIDPISSNMVCPPTLRNPMQNPLFWSSP